MTIRNIALLALAIAGIALSVIIGLFQPDKNLPPTAAPLFELMGKPLKTADRALTRVLPISDLDERELGEAIALRYASYRDEGVPEQKYLDELVQALTRNNEKGFEYRVFILPSSVPNAAAAPGGVLFVTSGLLTMVETESELVSILGHEIGHVELSHCMDMVRFQLLAQKIDSRPLGEIADIAVGIMLRPSFSKTQEADADRYGFGVLIREAYNPFGMANAFDKLAALDPSSMDRANPLYEYFMSHPYSKLRADRYRAEARQAELESYYVGKLNLEEKLSRFSQEYEKEWVRR